MRSVGSRLREERIRLGFSQRDVAAHAGVNKRSQLRFEVNAFTPDARYLERAASMGFDVLYVITGNRRHTTPALSLLSERESAMLSRFDFADKKGRKAIEDAAATAVAAHLASVS